MDFVADRWVYDRPQSRVEQGRIQRQHLVTQYTPSMMNYRNPLGTPLTFAVEQCTQSHLSGLDHLLYRLHRGTP